MAVKHALESNEGLGIPVAGNNSSARLRIRVWNASTRNIRAPRSMGSGCRLDSSRWKGVGFSPAAKWFAECFTKESPPAAGGGALPGGRSLILVRLGGGVKTPPFPSLLETGMKLHHYRSMGGIHFMPQKQ